MGVDLELKGLMRFVRVDDAEKLGMIQQKLRDYMGVPAIWDKYLREKNQKLNATSS